MQNSEEKKSLGMPDPESDLNTTDAGGEAMILRPEQRKFRPSANTVGLLGSGNEEFMSHPLF